MIFKLSYFIFKILERKRSSGFRNLEKVSDSDYDVKKLANEKLVYTVIDQLQW